MGKEDKKKKKDWNNEVEIARELSVFEQDLHLTGLNDPLQRDEALRELKRIKHRKFKQ